MTNRVGKEPKPSKLGQPLFRTESFSSVKTYITCPKKYKFHYSPQKRNTALTPAMKLGNLVHDGFAHSLLGKSTIAEIHASIDLDFIYAEEQEKARAVVNYYAPLLGFDKGIRALQIENKRIVEKKFEVDIAGVKILGYIDAILEDSNNITLVDWKTRAGLLDYEQIANDSQLYIYAYVAKEILGIDISQVCQVQINTSLPAKPKTVKSGTLSKTLGKTTEEVFLKSIDELGVTTDQFDMDIYRPKFVDPSEFLRVTYLDMGKVKRKTEEFILWCQRIQSDQFMLPCGNSNICKWCQYTDLCIDNA